jgi:hypothetical protein
MLFVISTFSGVLCVFLWRNDIYRSQQVRSTDCEGPPANLLAASAPPKNQDEQSGGERHSQGSNENLLARETCVHMENVT